MENTLSRKRKNKDAETVDLTLADSHSRLVLFLVDRGRPVSALALAFRFGFLPCSGFFLPSVIFVEGGSPTCLSRLQLSPRVCITCIPRASYSHPSMSESGTSRDATAGAASGLEP